MAKIIKFRVDRMRMRMPKLTDEAAYPIPADFSIEQYAQTVFKMFDGEECIVELACDHDMMKSIIDRFGVDVDTRIFTDKTFVARVLVNASSTFYSWVFQYAGKIKIILPSRIKEEYQAMVRASLENES